MPTNAFSHYPGGFTHGVVLRGLSVLNAHYGNIWWVDSGVGNDSGGADGSITKPFATIDYAVGRCTADNNDIIIVAPGHSETISAAAGIDLDVSGISIIGLGNGRERPTINFTATASDMDIDAANIYIENLYFDVTGIDAVVAAIDVNAADFRMVGCEVLMADSGGQATRFIVGATAADRMKILGNTIRSTTAGAASAINLVGTADGVEIGNNTIYGDFSVAAIENATGAGNVHTNLDIHNNYIRNDNVGNWAIELVAASTGTIRRNHIVTDAIATAVDWGAASAFENLYFDLSDADAAATAIPTAQTTGGMDLVTIGDRLGADADTDAIAAMLGGAAGIATMPAAAAPANAINVFELLRDIWASICGTAANENGIQTYPAAGALPANNVSLAEVLRIVYARNVAGINPLGTVVFVAASGGSDSNAGTSPNLPKATIASAITAAGAGGTIVLGPGTHSVDVSVAALAPLANQQFIGAIPSHGGRPQAVITHDADDGVNLVLLDVNGTFWKDITFLHVAGGASATSVMSISQTTAVTGVTFLDCWFDQNSVDIADIASIRVDDATNATVGLTVKHCRFIGGDATTNVMQYIDVGVGGTPDLLVEDCTFVLESADGDGTGIRFDDPGAVDGSYAITIHRNRFIGPTDGGGDPLGIIFAGAMTRDEIIGIISENWFAWCSATPVTQDKFNEGLVNNYVGDSATGGTLVDPGT